MRRKKPTLEHVDGARSRSNGERLVMKTRQGGRDTGIKKQGRGNTGEEKGRGAEEGGKVTGKKAGRRNRRGPGLGGLAGWREGPRLGRRGAGDMGLGLGC